MTDQYKSNIQYRREKLCVTPQQKGRRNAPKFHVAFDTEKIFNRRSVRRSRSRFEHVSAVFRVEDGNASTANEESSVDVLTNRSGRGGKSVG